MTRYMWTFVVAMAFFLPRESHAAAPHVDIDDYGLYTATLDASSNHAKDVELLKKTWRAPAEAGTLFGLRFTLTSEDASPATLTVRIAHPAVDDPISGRKTAYYETQRAVAPGVRVFHGQRLEKDAPSAVGRWIFQIRSGDEVLAEREFEVYAPEARSETGAAKSVAASPPPAGAELGSNAAFVAKEHGRCRGFAPEALHKIFPGRALAPEQSFALDLPNYGACCFLTLSAASGDSYALVSSQGQPLARFEPPAASAKTRAVGFEDFNNDGAPEIVLLTESADGLANRIYWSVIYGRTVYWTSIEAVDKDIARLRRYADIAERARSGRK